MEAQAIAQADYLDILFDNRNKKYGGYALRKYDDNRKVRALLLVLFFCGAVVAATLIPERQKIVERIEHNTVVTPTDPDKIIPKPPKPVEPAVAAPVQKPTIENPVMVISPDEIVTSMPPLVDSFAGRDSGPVTAAGEPDGFAVTKTNGNATGTPTVAPPSEPAIFVEQMPEFIGNIYEYLSKSVRYPQAAIQSGVQGRVLVRFVVNEDGSISSAKLMRGIGGGCDEEALRVVSSMPAWKPGKQNGRAVKVYFTLPISFRLE